MIASSQLSSITNIATADQAPCHRWRDWNGRRIDPSVRTRAPYRRNCDHYRAQEARHLAPKLREVLHRDFADCSALAETLSGQGAALFCLGAYTGAVPDAELRTITVGYTIEFARVLREQQPWR